MHSKIRNCKNCNLCENQPPLLQKAKKAHAMWVGLSAVRVDNLDCVEPLSPDTSSGKLIREIEGNIKSISFYRTNLVKCLPLKNGKIRYPTLNEASACFDNFILELKVIKPKFLILLGKQVSEFVQQRLGAKPSESCHIFDYQSVCVRGMKIISVHHPSYILIYKRSQVGQYAEAIQRAMAV